jgi:hypothetical protein
LSRTSAFRPAAATGPRRAHADGQGLLADIQPSEPLVLHLHLRPSSGRRPAGASSGGPSSQGHRPARSPQQSGSSKEPAIRGTRGPRAKHLCGLSRTSDGRRPRTTREFSPPEAATKIAKDYTSQSGALSAASCVSRATPRSACSRPTYFINAPLSRRRWRSPAGSAEAAGRRVGLLNRARTR